MDLAGTTVVAMRFQRVVRLPGRGQTVVWDYPGPPGAPVVVLLHGLTLNAELNWYAAIPALRRHCRVIALDQRGHGLGLPCPGPFRLEDCADDVAALANALDIDRLIPVGYSMGGLVAQLMWRRHSQLTAGLVLCATTREVSGSPLERAMSTMMSSFVTAVRWLPATYALRADVIGASLLDRDSDSRSRKWALAQMRRTPLRTALAAMNAACVFNSKSWIGSVDVPTAVVVNNRDRVVPPRRQLELGLAIRGSHIYEVNGDHGVFVAAPARFSSALGRACVAVAGGADGQAATGAPSLTAS
jgi:3-oxoadipate enol-lactonase